MKRSDIALIILAAILLAVFAMILMPAPAAHAEDGCGVIQPIPMPSPYPSCPEPSPEQDIGNPAEACPPYTDVAEHFEDGSARCSVSSGEVLIYHSDTGEWTLIPAPAIPDTAMEAPR